MAKWRGGTEPCLREATRHVRFLGEWLAVCGQHAVAYSDLPGHRLDDRLTCVGAVHS